MRLPVCDYRVRTEVDGLYFCRHRRVRAVNNLLSDTHCRCCRQHDIPCSNPRPIPDGPIAIPVKSSDSWQYISMEQMAADVRSLMGRLPSDLVAVAGIPRSGMPAASLLAMLLHLPLLEATHTHGLRPIENGIRLEQRPELRTGRVLVIDDSVYAGYAMRRVRQKLENDAARRFLFAALYPRPEAVEVLDIYARLAPDPHLFEWNLFNCNQTSEFAFDFDGILCEDFDGIDNDDAEYLEFLKNARPKWLPRRRIIPLIVTARLEKYRDPTMEWLSRHGVRVKNLVMGSWNSASERRLKFRAGEFKGKQYARSGCRLFIESDLKQAEQIFNVARRPVLCPTAGRVFQ